MDHRRSPRRLATAGAALSLLAGPPLLHAQAGMVLNELKISDTQGGLGGVLEDCDHFGQAIARFDDLDGDGNMDLAVGIPRGNATSNWTGGVWILFLRADGTVRGKQKIGNGIGGFTGTAADHTCFGASLAVLGDLDGDGVEDLAVGHPLDDQWGSCGAVWILLMHPNGTVKTTQKIGRGAGGFTGDVTGLDQFGSALAPLGDLDGDGVEDLAVGATGVDDPDPTGTQRGGLWILFLRPDGKVKGHVKICQGQGGFQGTLLAEDAFGSSLATLGDLDGNGTVDLAVGAVGEGDLAPLLPRRGGLWILFLRADGTVMAHQRINPHDGGFLGDLEAFDAFGASISNVGDLDGNGVIDLAVGAEEDDDGGANQGAIWTLFLAANGTVNAWGKISATSGSFSGTLDLGDRFGAATASLGDYDGDGYGDLVAGAWGDDDGTGPQGDRGAVWLLSLQGCPTASAASRNPLVAGVRNPSVYGVAGLPALGSTFCASIGTTGKLGSFLVGYPGPLTFSSPWGNVLVNFAHPAGEILGAPFAGGDPAVISFPLPDDPVLCGITLSTQGLRIGGGIDLTNAQDLVVGR